MFFNLDVNCVTTGLESKVYIQWLSSECLVSVQIISSCYLVTISTIYMATLLDCGECPWMRRSDDWDEEDCLMPEVRGGAPPRPSHTGHIWAAANHDICSLLNIILYQIGLLDTALDESSLLSLPTPTTQNMMVSRTYSSSINIERFSKSLGKAMRNYQGEPPSIFCNAMERHYVSEQKL